MRHKSILIAGFALLIFLTILLLSRQSLISQLTLSILYGLIIIVQLIFLLIDDELSMAHAFVTFTLFTSLAYLIINLMGTATLSTFLLGALFILLFLVSIVLILVYDWKQYTMFDKMFNSKKQKEDVIPVESLIEEPPHFRIKNDDEGEWVELQIKPAKSAVTAKKSSVKKTAKKKATKRNTTKK